MFDAWVCSVALKSWTKVQTLPETPLKNLARRFKRLARFTIVEMHTYAKFYQSIPFVQEL